MIDDDDNLGFDDAEATDDEDDDLDVAELDDDPAYNPDDDELKGIKGG